MTGNGSLNGWARKTLRDLATINYGKSPKEILSSDGLYPVVGTGGNERYGDGFLYDGESIILGRKGTIDRVHFATGRFWAIDTAYYLSNFNDALPLWLFYFLNTIDLRQLNEATGVPSLSRDLLYQIEVAKPPKPEQTKIAEILSTADRAIEQMEGLIAKHQRIKTGLMQDLLTRGIDEHGNLRSEETHKFKNSLLGRIPVEWNVERLGTIAQVSSGLTLGKTHSGPNTIELPYLRVANVQDGYLNLDDVKTIRVPVFYAEKYELMVGDVLMNEGGDFDKLGRGTVWRGEIPHCLHQNHVFKVRPKDKVLASGFLAYVSSSPYGKAFFVLASKQSTNLASINSTQLKTFPVSLPSYCEQEKIEEVLSQNETRINLFHERLRKLRSLKTALMQDLLPGNVRVLSLLEDK